MDGRVRTIPPFHHGVCPLEVATGKLLRELELPTDGTGPLAISADGKLMAVGFGLR